jgi:acyl-CoA hydrolase
VTADKIQFLVPIIFESIVEVFGNVVKVEPVKIVIHVEILIQDIITGIKTKAISAMFTFVAINEANKPISIEEKLHLDNFSEIVC